jgi:hypothetical protein
MYFPGTSSTETSTQKIMNEHFTFQIIPDVRENSIEGSERKRIRPATRRTYILYFPILLHPLPPPRQSCWLVPAWIWHVKSRQGYKCDPTIDSYFMNITENKKVLQWKLLNVITFESSIYWMITITNYFKI